MSVGGINTVGTVGASQAPAVVRPVAAVTSTPAVTASVSSASPKIAGTDTGRLVSDPAAKVIITQYVDSQNDIVSQTPSKAVVAYLENGLTADGFSKQSSVA